MATQLMATAYIAKNYDESKPRENLGKYYTYYLLTLSEFLRKIAMVEIDTDACMNADGDKWDTKLLAEAYGFDIDKRMKYFEEKYGAWEPNRTAKPTQNELLRAGHEFVLMLAVRHAFETLDHIRDGFDNMALEKLGKTGPNVIKAISMEDLQNLLKKLGG